MQASHLEQLSLSQIVELLSDLYLAFSSDYAVVLFGLSGLIVTFTALFNPALSNLIASTTRKLYRISAALSLVVIALCLCLVLLKQSALSLRVMVWLEQTLLAYPKVIYVVSIFFLLAVINCFVFLISRHSPNQHSRVVVFGLLLGFAYFCFEVQSINAVHPLQIIMTLIITLIAIYLFGWKQRPSTKNLVHELDTLNRRRTNIREELSKRGALPPLGQPQRPEMHRDTTHSAHRGERH
ncbi:MAG: hypothetical protein ACPG4U_14990 [Pseudomonadales bacterium]